MESNQLGNMRLIGTLLDRDSDSWNFHHEFLRIDKVINETTQLQFMHMDSYFYFDSKHLMVARNIKGHPGLGLKEIQLLDLNQQDTFKSSLENELKTIKELEELASNIMRKNNLEDILFQLPEGQWSEAQMIFSSGGLLNKTKSW